MNEEDETVDTEVDPSVEQDEADITPTIGDVESYLEEDLMAINDRVSQLEAFQKSAEWEDELPHDQKVTLSEYLGLLRTAKALLTQFFPE